MQVYVANGTLQPRQINYRVIEGRDFRTLHISEGQQSKFPEDFSPEQIEALIPQIEQAGGVQVEDIPHILPFGIVYSVGKKPIPSDALDAARVQDEEARQKVADKKLEQEGLTAFHGAREKIRKQGGNPDKLIATTTQIEQLRDTDREEVLPKGGVDSKVTVSRKVSGGPVQRSNAK
jgi:hypothetical protein